LLQYFNIYSFTLWMPTFVWMPGTVVPFASPLYTPLGTIYGGLLSESLNYVMGKSGYVTMNEIEK